MSNTVKTTSANTTDPTLTDPRVAALAEFTGLEPAEVVEHVREDATADGNTVDAELDQDVAIVTMVAELGQESDENDNDL
jgi:flagellar basal body rod protein FlgB